MWLAVELREIRTFVVLADELHFARTAERLHLTPSRVSQIIRELERKLGVQLVHRTSRRVELTTRGAQLRDEAGPVYEQLVDALARTSATGRGIESRLRVGLFSGVAAGPHLPRIVRTFEARHPECAVVVSEIALGGSLVSRLEDGEADLIATWLPPLPDEGTHLIIGPILTEEPRALAVAPDHPFAQRETVSVEELAEHTMVEPDWLPKELRGVWFPETTPSGRPFRRHHLEHHDRGRLLSELGYLVASGKVVYPTVPSLAKIFGHLDVVYVPIAKLPPLRSGLVWLSTITHTAVREFVRITGDVLETAQVGHSSTS
jgi:DNA-binding transcriptional LysR family regulator